MTIRPCWVEICTRALEDNFRFLLTRAAPHAELMAGLKADAYGHSLALCAPAVERAGVQWLALASAAASATGRALRPQARVVLFCGPFLAQSKAVASNG